MSGHSNKKDKLSRQKASRYLLLSIIIASALYIFINAYQIFFKGHEVTKRQICGFAFLSGVNYLFYRLINAFRGSYWESYMIDILGLNLAVEVLVNFYWKFWYLYLIYPGLFCMWAGKKIYEYVKTIGKDNPSEETPNQHEPQKQKTKTKYVKVR